MICHKCLASKGDPFSYKELKWQDASWLQTVGTAMPWPGQPNITRIPGFSVETDRWDLLHNYHLGFGRDAAGSALVILLQDGVWPGANWDLRLKSAWSTFLSWCKACKKRPRMKEFSGALGARNSLLEFLGVIVPCQKMNPEARPTSG
jgi:hypothetical protein